MEQQEAAEVKTDKQGRVLDKQGHPMRFKKVQPAFHGSTGRPNPRLEKLEERQKAFDDLGQRRHSGLKRPGSFKK